MALCPRIRFLFASKVRVTLNEYSRDVVWVTRPCRGPGFEEESCKMKVFLRQDMHTHYLWEDTPCVINYCFLSPVHGVAWDLDQWSSLLFNDLHVGLIVYCGEIGQMIPHWQLAALLSIEILFYPLNTAWSLLYLRRAEIKQSCLFIFAHWCCLTATSVIAFKFRLCKWFASLS